MTDEQIQINELKFKLEEAKKTVQALILAGNAVCYELQDTDPVVKFDTIGIWKQAVRSARTATGQTF